MSKLFKIKHAPLTIAERWCDSFLVTYPVSQEYNGGTIIDGVWYKGYEVPAPKFPKGFKVVSIGCGLQHNAHPPYATVYLQPEKPGKVKKAELKAAIEAAQ